MRRIVKAAAITAASVAVLLIVAVGAIYGVSGRRLNRTYPAPPPANISVSTDPAVIERGRHLVTAVGNCTECHAEDLGGKVFMDAGPMGIAAGRNLTSGQGGIGGTFTEQDWVRAIRHGQRADGTSLIIMPSEAFAHFTDADLSAIISYLEQIPPVDREIPDTKLRVVGRALLAADKLPVLVAELVPPIEARTPVPAGPTADYGRYLAEVSGCRTCHTPDLAGGVVTGPPGSPASANLTPAGIGSWTEADFFRALREGVRPDGSAISEVMPWRFAGRMTDEELRAIWLYLQSVPAKPTPVN